MDQTTVQVASLKSFKINKDERLKDAVATFNIELPNGVYLNEARLVRRETQEDNNVVVTFQVFSAPRFVEDPNGRHQLTSQDGRFGETRRGRWQSNWVVNDPWLLNPIKQKAIDIYQSLVEFSQKVGKDTLPRVDSIDVYQVPRQKFQVEEGTSLEDQITDNDVDEILGSLEN